MSAWLSDDQSQTYACPMSGFLQRLDGTDFGSEGTRDYQETVGMITELIEGLRAAREWRDFYELQRRIGEVS